MKNQYHFGFLTRPFILLFLLSCCFTVNAQERNKAQKRVLDHAAFFKSSKAEKPMSKLTNISALDRSQIEKGVDVDKAIFLSFDKKKISEMMSKKADMMVMSLPYEGSTTLELYLIKSKVFTDEFKVYTGSNRLTPFPYKKGTHYWGMAKDDPNSMVAISFYDDEIVGTMKVHGKSYDLGKIRNNRSKHHILYENKDIKKQFDLNCLTTDTEEHSHKRTYNKASTSALAVSNNCVKMYLETDYSMYQHYGSVESVTNYVTGAFNQVILLYANESINMSINELVVWDVVDPYPGTNTSDALTQFRNGLAGNYNGDLAHLISRSTEISGGRAYVNVLCNATYGVGVSGINASYNNVPTYSWTVMVLAHEIGHNLGSSHTHSCSWNGNGTAIDDCGNVYYITNNKDDNEDGIVDNLADAQVFSPCFDNVDNIIPSEGGTIMSYCHLNNVGIDLSLGFGQQPGDLIRSNVANASCLTVCNGGPLVIELASTDVTCGVSDDGTATVTASGGTGSYSYSWSNGATGSSIANLAAGTYTVTVDDGNETIQDNVSITDNNNTYYADTDDDGFGDSGASILACSQPANYVIDSTDCNDDNNTIYPDAPEICDGLDNNCSGAIDEGLTFNTFYADGDGDGYGNPNVTISACAAPNGYVVDNTDCSDDNSNINPGMAELCDGIDNNCDGNIDENVSTNTYYADTDGDGYGDPNNNVEDCSSPQGFVLDNTDCNDNDSSIYPTGSCDDGDSCTINDAYDANCNCTGTLTPDSDGDGVCDANDVCQGGDDNLDTDNDGTPDFCDCNAASSSFASSTLSHSGGGSNTASLSLSNGSRDPSFTISEINQRTSGKPTNRYVELVTVSYVNGDGITIIEGSYSGASASSTTISILDEVQSISIILEDTYDGNTNGNMNVSLSSVSYCAPWDDPGCTDSDGDGICNENDVCPGGDDTIDTDGDGIPDDCDTLACQNTVTNVFIDNPLTHSGSGSSSTTLVFLPGAIDISFNIFNIDQKVNGKPSRRYSERVIVTYVDGSGSNQTYGTFQGISSTDINISGDVQSVTLTLDDTTGNNSTSLSVNMSDVELCLDSTVAPALPETSIIIRDSEMKLYPNPAKNDVFVRFAQKASEVKVTFYDVIGNRLKEQNFSNKNLIKLDIRNLSKGNLYFVIIEVPGHSREIRKLILLD